MRYNDTEDIHDWWRIDGYKTIIVCVNGIYGVSNRREGDKYNRELGIAIALRRAILTLMGYKLETWMTRSHAPYIHAASGEVVVPIEIYQEMPAQGSGNSWERQGKRHSEIIKVNPR